MTNVLFFCGHHFLITFVVLNQVRNEKAEEFLALLKEWQRLCASFSLIKHKEFQQKSLSPEIVDNNEDDEEEVEVDDEEIFEVEKILSICYGLPAGQKELGLYFKVLVMCSRL